jgi:hypothetical protein
MPLRRPALVYGPWLERLSWLVSDRHRTSNVRGDETSLDIQVLNLLPCEVITYDDVAVGTRDGVIAEVQLIEERVTSRECDA